MQIMVAQVSPQTFHAIKHVSAEKKYGGTETTVVKPRECQGWAGEGCEPYEKRCRDLLKSCQCVPNVE